MARLRTFFAAAVVSLTMATLVVPVAAQVPPAPSAKEIDAELNRLVVESIEGKATAFADGVLTVRQNGGWARTRRIVSDFSLNAQFRLLSARTELDVGIRTVNIQQEWPHRGYRIRLAASKPVQVIGSGYRIAASPGIPVTIADTEWHSLSVKASGRIVEVSVDGQNVGRYEIETRAGAVLFQTAAGDAEVRSIDLAFQRLTAVLERGDFKRPEVKMPSVEREVKPNYTRDAMAAKVEGVVLWEALVEDDGRVGGMRLLNLLHPELEHASLDALRKWKFKPALLDGKAVSILVEIEMSFRLRK